VKPERGAHAALVGLVLAGAAQCSRANHGAPGGPDGTSGSPPGSPAFVLNAPPTTSPVIALHNLDADVADREKRAARGEANAPAELVSYYLVRAKYVGRVADLIAADTTSAGLVATRDGDAKAHVTRAKVLSAIHEFAAAQKELDRAAALKGRDPDIDVDGERAVILLAVGREDEAAALLLPVDRASPSDLVMRGGVEARLGHAAESDRLFELARARYRDVSAFTVAGMDFEHSRALELGGDRAKARAYLSEAATVMPSYAHAVVHLASLEPPDRALPRLETLEKTSDDPDVLGGEADALRRAGRAQEAAAMTVRARARFDEVLARLPRAYADHAASFYLGMGGDPQRAVTLAHANAENRPTDEAVELWLTAAQAASSHDETCAAARRALGLVHATSGLRERAATALKGCP
jgi:tetratricopeptide (TPR) repeat protein